jgi:hypothetical protein
MSSISDFASYYVVETNARSWLGPYLYSDRRYPENSTAGTPYQSPLNELSRIPFIGSIAGTLRMALAAIHSLGHLLAAALTGNKGHLYHAAKGGCEYVRGYIEETAMIGRIFANVYYYAADWWVMKIYSPSSPDSLDKHRQLWVDFKNNHANRYTYCDFVK